MRPRVASSLLWGVVGSLSFLVLVQGYALLVGPLGTGLAVIFGVALLVGVVVGLTTYLSEHRLAKKGRT
ncbi:MAG: hypothetical protein ACQETI_06450 [Halobacteriota archaeon]